MNNINNINNNNNKNHIHVFKKHAIFSKCLDNNKPNNILQEILYTQHPNCFIKQQRACIKFNKSTSLKKTILQTPPHKLYSLLNELKNILDEIIFICLKYNHIIAPIDIYNIHYFDHHPIIISNEPIQPITDNIINPIHTSRTNLATFISQILNIHPQKIILPKMSPLALFITQHTTHNNL